MTDEDLSPLHLVTSVYDCNFEERLIKSAPRRSEKQETRREIKRRKNMSDYIPDEVLANIFCRLPAKEVLDCRCVCKSWRSIISNSTFISQYTQLSLKNKSNNSRFILSHYDIDQCKYLFTLHTDASFGQEYEELELPFDHGLSSYMVIGFCCGLVCLLEISTKERLPESIVIWNPSVGYSFKTFPVEPPLCKIDELEPFQGYGPSIRFHEGKVPHYSIFGFGFDPKSCDYKVVRVVYRCQGLYKAVPKIADVFSLSTGKWKNITASELPYIIQESSAHACVNGAIHWIGYYRGSDDRLVSQLILAVFDLGDELFKEFKLPDELVRESAEREEDRQKLCVGVIRESLALMHYQINPNFRIQTLYLCNIWVMNEYGVKESWIKLHTINIFLGLGKILWLKRNSELVLATVNHRDGEELHGDVHVINSKNRTVRRLQIQGNPWNFFMDSYLECLVIYQKVNGIPTMSTSTATTSKQELGVGTSGLKITDKAKEFMEEE